LERGEQNSNGGGTNKTPWTGWGKRRWPAVKARTMGPGKKKNKKKLDAVTVAREEKVNNTNQSKGVEKIEGSPRVREIQIKPAEWRYQNADAIHGPDV